MVRLVEVVEDNLLVVGDKLKVVGMVVEDKLKAEGEEGMVMADMFLNLVDTFLNLVDTKDRVMGLGMPVMGLGMPVMGLDKEDLQIPAEVLSIERLGVQEVLHTVVLMVQSLFLVSAMPDNAKNG